MPPFSYARGPHLQIHSHGQVVKFKPGAPSDCWQTVLIDCPVLGEGESMTFEITWEGPATSSIIIGVVDQSFHSCLNTHITDNLNGIGFCPKDSKIYARPVRRIPGYFGTPRSPYESDRVNISHPGTTYSVKLTPYRTFDLECPGLRLSLDFPEDHGKYLPAISLRGGASATIRSMKILKDEYRQDQSGPRLVVHPCSRFASVWNDKGSGGWHDGSAWRPQCNPATQGYPLGHTMQGNYRQPSQPVMCVRAAPGHERAVAKPVDFHKIWEDCWSGARKDGSLWAPIAPHGYQALGMVWVNGYSKPSLDSMICVRSDLVVPARWGDWIYNDKGTGARARDIGLWRVSHNEDGLPTGTFGVQFTHSKDRPTQDLFTLKKSVCLIE
eukprot:gnl/Dysnectes_brevis/840_a927_2894.p1 GENE.gnl/Dysnectes_brevis/840_a927_2894~~gnl/Dysnectes_brevis/840_a927_2894.p1  ORF type:complete len:390 (+),score=37.03 gnl/Dysnectes_brevis/840_a927_2894:24-1172(+)